MSSRMYSQLTRAQNCRFYGELAKFKVARPYAILHPLKIFLDDFKPNIENIANLLETCGRFLLRNEGTAETAKQMVSSSVQLCLDDTRWTAN